MRPNEKGRAVAAIDIGTNSVLMLISRRGTDATLEIRQDRATITRLGEGLHQRGILLQAAMERTLAALGEFAQAAAQEHAELVAVGTSALREARNAQVFVEAARRVLGVPVEIISGQREAQLAFRGAVQGLNLAANEVTAVDVGGGSTEIVRGRDGNMLASASLKLGAVRLAEKHGLEAPATAAQLSAMSRDVDATLKRARVALGPPLVATGGTATTLAAVMCEIEPYDAASVHGSRLTDGDLRQLFGCLASMSMRERCELKGMEPGRADIIVPGALILIRLSARARAREVVVSSGGVRLGLTLEVYSAR